MQITLKQPLLGMVEGVQLPRDTTTPIDLPDHAALDLISRKIAVAYEPPAVEPEVEAEAEVKVEVKAEPPVETRVVEAAEKRGPGRPPKQ